MDNRRKLPRWEIKKQVKSWVPLIQGFGHCVVEDLHLKGMRVSFDNQLPHQEKIRMSFDLWDEYDFIMVESQITWKKQEHDRFVYGLSFNNISESDKEKISQYILTKCYDQLREKWWVKESISIN